MAKQLLDFVRSGGVIDLGTRQFTLDGSETDGDISVATFVSGSRSYTGVLCVNAKVPGKPDAEVWAIMGSKRTLATFAIHHNGLLRLR
ncbi:MAG: hypothetical protein ACRER5_16280 [Pseudomonas sp.]